MTKRQKEGLLVDYTLSNEEIEQLNELMSQDMTYYSDRILNLYTLFEDENKDWDNKEEVINDLISKINSIENEIISDNKLQDWEKTALLASSTTAKSFTSSFIVLSEKVAGTAHTQRFFKKLWRGIKRVARATAKVVASAVIVVARTVGYGIYGGFHRMLNSGDIGEAAFAGAGCAVAGAVQGFFGGIKRSFTCYDNFSLKCMMSDSLSSGCLKDPYYEGRY